MVRPLLTRLLLGPLLLGLAGPALAQPRPAPPPAAPAAPGPDRTTAQFGDWTLTCIGATGARQCELTQTVQDRQRQQTAVVALGQTTRGVPPKLLVRVPGVISVGVPLKLELEATETLVLPFRFCGPTGCLAELELRDEALLRRLRARPADRPGRVQWRDGGNNEATFNLSFRGFAAALDALARETR